MSSSIRYLFEPRNVAIIGASKDPKKIGYKILSNLIASGYRGAIYPINPAGGEILGRQVYPSIQAVPERVDVVCTTIPAAHVFDAVKACADCGVRYNLIISSGFSEVGNTEEEHRIAAYAQNAGMRIVGPNIFGVYSAEASMDATFGPGNILPGSVAIVTQSGALGLAMIGKTHVENIGLSAIVSVGNKCDVDEADLLEYLTEQRRTRVILMYIEGIKNGPRFIEAVKKATRVKPVVVIKSGRSERGAVAAASHTGSLAGSDEIVDAIFRQCGVMRADSIRDAFNWCKYLAHSPPPTSDQAVIITNGGGIGVMATDACERYHVELYDDGKTLKKLFGPVTPSFGSTKNPIDITGGAAGAEYDAALTVALKHKGIGASIALYCETATFLAADLERVLENTYRNYQEKKKPILFAIVGGEEIEHALVRLSRKNVPVFGDVYEAVSCLGVLYRYHRYLKNRDEVYETFAFDGAPIEEICRNARAQGRSFLLAHEAQQIMAHVGIPVPRSTVARSLSEAVQAAESIGFPVVMKVVSRDIIHKSDAGGVALNLESRDEVIDAYQAIMQNCRAYNPNAVIEGVEVAEMLLKDVETIIGARRDPAFGPIIMFGLGGIYVEVMKDVAFRALPLSRREITEMIKETRTYPLLLGVRGEAQKDLEAVITSIVKLGALMSRCTMISDIEINPLMVYEQGLGAKAVDVRILLSQDERSLS
ncbi:MAG: acetate--CoA ligase family protein [Desulfobacterota bacterium]|nr:acetate--CoA ligase family protein [Thermodesulfobacteriota bacterium]